MMIIVKKNKGNNINDDDNNDHDDNGTFLCYALVLEHFLRLEIFPDITSYIQWLVANMPID